MFVTGGGYFPTGYYGGKEEGVVYAQAMQGSSHILLVIIQLQNLIDGRRLGGSWRRLGPQADGAVVPLAACTGSAKREKGVCV